jgi:hypothetical protein
VIALGKPTVIVLLNGGSVALEQEMAAPNVAIIEAFYPGTMGSEAIAGAIFAMSPPPAPADGHDQSTATAAAAAAAAASGASSASGVSGGAAASGYVDRWGRLPYSVYPAKWIHNNPMDQMDLAARPGRTYKYSEADDALYTFGSGLQYTKLALSVQSSCSAIDTATLTTGGDATKTPIAPFTLLLRNTANATTGHAAEAVVTMFIMPLKLPTQPAHYPLKQQMVGFQRIEAIAPGAQVAVTFNATATDLSVVDYSTGERVLTPGTYSVYFSTGTAAVVRPSKDFRISGPQEVLEPFPQPE